MACTSAVGERFYRSDNQETRAENYLLGVEHRIAGLARVRSYANDLDYRAGWSGVPFQDSLQNGWVQCSDERQSA